MFVFHKAVSCVFFHSCVVSEIKNNSRGDCLWTVDLQVYNIGNLQIQVGEVKQMLHSQYEYVSPSVH